MRFRDRPERFFALVKTTEVALLLTPQNKAKGEKASVDIYCREVTTQKLFLPILPKPSPERDVPCSADDEGSAKGVPTAITVKKRPSEEAMMNQEKKTSFQVAFNSNNDNSIQNIETLRNSEDGNHHTRSTNLLRLTDDVQYQSQNENMFKWKRLLILLHHSGNCQASTRLCKATLHCDRMKRVWKHIRKCRKSDCRFPLCQSSRYLLQHYRTCRFGARCQLCEPVRKAIFKSEQLRK
jgi:hypothetical protein